LLVSISKRRFTIPGLGQGVLERWSVDFHAGEEDIWTFQAVHSILAKEQHKSAFPLLHYSRSFIFSV
jgi:hypothetical protein